MFVFIKKQNPPMVGLFSCLFVCLISSQVLI